MIVDFILLLQFFTRIPINNNVEYNEIRYGKSSKFLPLVGGVIGILLVFFYKLLSYKLESTYLIATFVLIAEILLTGALHLDGFSDSFDAFFSYRDRDRMLEIMKDSRIGVNGVIGVGLLLVLKIFLIASVHVNFIYIMPIISRLGLVYSASISTYAREKGMGGAMIINTGKKEFFVAFLISLILILPVIDLKVLICIVFVIFLTHLNTLSVVKKIGGTTGDTLGMTVELNEIYILILALFLV